MWGVVGCARIDEGALRGDFNGLIHLREGEDFFHLKRKMWKRQAKVVARILISLLFGVKKMNERRKGVLT